MCFVTIYSHFLLSVLAKQILAIGISIVRGFSLHIPLSLFLSLFYSLSRSWLVFDFCFLFTSSIRVLLSTLDTILHEARVAFFWDFPDTNCNFKHWVWYWFVALMSHADIALQCTMFFFLFLFFFFFSFAYASPFYLVHSF